MQPLFNRDAEIISSLQFMRCHELNTHDLPRSGDRLLAVAGPFRYS
jgi:hypothetical protein